MRIPQSCLIGLTLLCATAQAELVDNDDYTTDTVTALDWQDLTETAGLTRKAALEENEGWRNATNSEVEKLFGQLFSGYYDTNEGGLSDTDEDAYADQTRDVESFHDLFGINFEGLASSTFGLYKDEDKVLRIMGASNTLEGDGGEPEIVVSVRSVVAGLEHASDFQPYNKDVANFQVGTYLVRDSSYEAAPRDIAALTDVSDDAVADLALLNLSGPVSAGPIVSVHSGSDGTLIASYELLNSNWGAIRMASGSDANGDLIADDPLIAVLAENRSTGKAAVSLIDAATGSKLRANLEFFSSLYNSIDVAVLNDTNGDGLTNDASVAVLAQKGTSGRQAVIVRSIATGKQLANWDITADSQELVGLAGIDRNAGNSLLAVLVTDTSNNTPKVITIDSLTGEQNEQKIAGSWLAARDIAVQRDGNGDGTANDPAYVVLGDEDQGNSLLRIRDVNSGAKIQDVSALSDKWNATRIGVLPDINSNAFEDAVVLATKVSDSSVRIKIRDLESGENGGSFDPDEL